MEALREEIVDVILKVHLSIKDEFTNMPKLRAATRKIVDDILDDHKRGIIDPEYKRPDEDACYTYKENAHEIFTDAEWLQEIRDKETEDGILNKFWDYMYYGDFAGNFCQLYGDKFDPVFNNVYDLDEMPEDFPEMKCYCDGAFVFRLFKIVEFYAPEFRMGDPEIRAKVLSDIASAPQ